MGFKGHVHVSSLHLYYEMFYFDVGSGLKRHDYLSPFPQLVTVIDGYHSCHSRPYVCHPCDNIRHDSDGG